VLRLTPSAGGQSGAVYTTTPVTLGSGSTFSTQFQFRFTDPAGIDPADGITFVLSNGSAGLGTDGGGLGYQGASAQSVAIEFDTYENGGDDSSSNHVAIDTGGVLEDLDLTNAYGVANCNFGGGIGTGCMSDGDLWTVLIEYDGTDLSLWVTDPAEGPTDQIYNDLPIDISSYLGTSSATLGFTGSTGSGYENQDIVDWTYSNTSTLPTTTVPEPSSLLMLGSGLAAAAAMLRRRLFN
jgi:hypothetical protein